MRGEQKEGRACKCQQRHHHIIMQYDKESRDKMVNGDNDRGQPGNGVPGHRPDIRIEAVQHVAVAVSAEREPVRINDLIENVRLDRVIDIDAEL